MFLKTSQYPDTLYNLDQWRGIKLVGPDDNGKFILSLLGQKREGEDALYGVNLFVGTEQECGQMLTFIEQAIFEQILLLNLDDYPNLDYETAQEKRAKRKQQELRKIRAYLTGSLDGSHCKYVQRGATTIPLCVSSKVRDYDLCENCPRRIVYAKPESR